MPTKAAPREVIYARHAPRWTHVVLLAAAWLLTGIIVGTVFVGVDQPGFTQPDEFPLGVKIGAGLVAGVAFALGAVAAYRLVRNPPVLKLYEDGFEYEPAGVSTGFIKWSDVVELRDESVLASLVGSPARRAVTAVVLRNPDDYVKRFPAVMRPVFEMNRQLNSSPILITPGEFGAEHDAIIAVMREEVAKARGEQGRSGEQGARNKPPSSG